MLKGFLDDCMEGCTLRSYLARRLNCAPMRISKKFAGRCIGKLAYVKCDERFEFEKMKSPLKALEEIYLNNREKRQHMHLQETDDTGDYDLSYSDDDSRSENSEKYSNTSPVYSESIHSYDRKTSVLNLVGLGSSAYEDYHFAGIYHLDETMAAAFNSAEADDWKEVLTYFCGEDSIHLRKPSEPQLVKSSSSCLLI